MSLPDVVLVRAPPLHAQQCHVNVRRMLPYKARLAEGVQACRTSMCDSFGHVQPQCQDD